MSSSWDPMDCRPPGFSVHGISQARILEWVVISFSRASPWPGDWTLFSCLAGGFFPTESPGRPLVKHRLLFLKTFLDIWFISSSDAICIIQSRLSSRNKYPLISVVLHKENLSFILEDPCDTTELLFSLKLFSDVFHRLLLCNGINYTGFPCSSLEKRCTSKCISLAEGTPVAVSHGRVLGMWSTLQDSFWHVCLLTHRLPFKGSVK